MNFDDLVVTRRKSETEKDSDFVKKETPFKNSEFFFDKNTSDQEKDSIIE